jgi:hypothetical protein
VPTGQSTSTGLISGGVGGNPNTATSHSQNTTGLDATGAHAIHVASYASSSAGYVDVTMLSSQCATVHVDLTVSGTPASAEQPHAGLLAAPG